MQAIIDDANFIVCSLNIASEYVYVHIFIAVFCLDSKSIFN